MWHILWCFHWMSGICRALGTIVRLGPSLPSWTSRYYCTPRSVITLLDVPQSILCVWCSSLPNHRYSMFVLQLYVFLPGSCHVGGVTFVLRRCLMSSSKFDSCSPAGSLRSPTYVTLIGGRRSILWRPAEKTCLTGLAPCIIKNLP